MFRVVRIAIPALGRRTLVSKVCLVLMLQAVRADGQSDPGADRGLAIKSQEPVNVAPDNDIEALTLECMWPGSISGDGDIMCRLKVSEHDGSARRG